MSDRKIFRVVLLGNSGVGKTSIVRMFTEEAFTASYPSTIGVFNAQKRVNYNGKTAILDISDTGGQERYSSLAPIYCRNADAVLICYDITDVRTFEKIDDWRLTGGIPEKALIVVVGCKSDLVHQRDVTPEMVSRMETKLKNIKFFETSAKSNQNVSEVFMYLLSVLMPQRTEGQRAHLGSVRSTEGTSNITVHGKSNGNVETKEETSCC